MTKIEWLELAQRKLNEPVTTYHYPELTVNEYEERIQDVNKILNEVIGLLKEER